MEEVTLDLLLDRVREAGVVGMGGGAAPTVQKLEQAAGKVDTVIINGAECEPYVTADHRLLLERIPFFSLKLEYDSDELIKCVLDGKELELTAF